MIEIQRILCPTDFSGFSRRAFRHAVALARWYGADIEALHVVPLLVPSPTGAFAYPGWSALNPPVRRELEAELERFVEPGRQAGIRVEATLHEGDPVGEIVAAARTLPADLVVIGSHGRGGFERWVLGSVTEKVIRKSPSPALVVTPPAEPPTRPADVAYKRILCPVDFSEASLAALRYALSLAQEAGARLILLHVVEWLSDLDRDLQPGLDLPELRRLLEGDARERLRQAVPAEARNWCTPEEIVTGGKAYREILRLAREREAQLIVMGAHGRGPWERMLFGSTTHHVMRSATCPVLTIRPGVVPRHTDVEASASAVQR
jgi:nucleotide-binding universal stress UspA family protein